MKKETRTRIVQWVTFIVPILMIGTVALIIYAFWVDLWPALRICVAIFWGVFSLFFLMCRASQNIRSSIKYGLIKHKVNDAGEDWFPIVASLLAFAFALYAVIALTTGLGLGVGSMPQSQDAPQMLVFYLLGFIGYVTYCVNYALKLWLREPK